MGLALVYMIGVFILFLCEVFIVFWFVGRVTDLRRGITNFKISIFVPALYLVYLIPLINWILGTDHGGLFYQSDYIPVATRESNAMLVFVLFNLSTPLFPLLAWLKYRKIKSMDNTTPPGPVEANP